MAALFLGIAMKSDCRVLGIAMKSNCRVLGIAMKISTSHLPPLALSLILIAGVFWAGYQVGRNGAQAATQALRQDWVSQQEDLLALRQVATAQMENTAQRLGILQARLIRMESLGQQILDLGVLGDMPLDLDEPPALGGPIDTELRKPTYPDLLAQIAALGQRIEAGDESWQDVFGWTLDRYFQSKRHPAGYPVEGGVITSRYGRRQDPFSGDAEFHRGIDIAAPIGTLIRAVASGLVTAATYSTGYGNLVEIRHADGYLTRYAHCQRLKVAAGDIVSQGQVIATLGRSGRATGAHVHFEVHKDGRHTDPARYLRERGWLETLRE